MTDRVLQTWQCGELPFTSIPKTVRKLTGGRSNDSFLVSADDGLYVVRYERLPHRQTGVDRYREIQIMRQAAAAGLAPPVIHCLPGKGLLVTRYIDGRHLQPADANDEKIQTQLLELLHALHQIGPGKPPFDYHAHMENYMAAALARGIQIPPDLAREHHELQAILTGQDFGAVICHHDPTPANILQSGESMYLLDWEYAACGWPALDFAALSAEWGISADSVLGATGLTPAEFESALRLYRHLCRLWALVTG